MDGSLYEAVRAVTRVDDISFMSLVALLDDVEACKDWADRCIESTIYQRLSETEAYVYTHNDLPFPVKDRDILTHVFWHQNPGTYEVVMSSNATTGVMDEVKGWLRLTEATTQWLFRPLLQGQIEVSNETHINPGSSMPGWITNMLLVDTPHEALKSFVEEASKPKYQQAKVSFIVEPPIQLVN